MSLRLIATMIRDWAIFDGYALAHGVGDLRDLTIDRVCNFIWWFLIRNTDEQGVHKLKTRLWMPPKGVPADPRSPWSPENETNALKALGAGLGMIPKTPTIRPQDAA